MRIFSLLLIVLCSFNLSAQTNCAAHIYVTPTGGGAASGTIGNPTNLANAISLVTAGRHHILMLSGTYNVAFTASFLDSTVLDGGYDIIGGEWIKSSNLTTTVNCAAPLLVSGGAGHYVAFQLNSVGNVYLKDITLNNTTNAVGTTSNKGRSVYGVHIANSNNFYFTRMNITTGNGSAGANGAPGALGLNGFNGRQGHPGDNDGSSCGGAGGVDDGQGGNGAGAGGGGGAGSTTCNGSTNGSTGGLATGRNGSGGGGGGAGGADFGANGRPGGAGGLNFIPGGSPGFGGFTPGNCNAGQNGGVGANGANGVVGANGVTVSTSSLLTYFLPGASSQNGFDGRGGTGGGGGGGGGGEEDDGGSIFSCTIDDGSGAGGGGQGATGGTGGNGGGGTFAIYGQTGIAGANLFDINSAVGAGGVGGTGGTGGTGGNGGTGSVGEVGFGGNGGTGGAGGNGGNGANGANGISTNISGLTTIGSTVPNTFTITASMFGGCTNSEYILTKSGGTWTLPAGASYINDLTPTTSSYSNTDNTVKVYFNAIGHTDITVDATAYKNYLYTRSTRTAPDYMASVPSFLCANTGSITFASTVTGTSYEWIVYKDGDNVNTPVATYSTSNPVWSPTADGTYWVRQRVKEDCCGWSLPVYKEISVGPDVDTLTVATCDSYLWNVTGTTYTTTGFYADTTANINGCDSISNLDLTINNNTGIDVQSLCNSYIFNGVTYTTSNSTALDTLTNALGCDSVITLNLTINNNIGIDTQIACETYTWTNGMTYVSSNNTALDTLTNVLGCDSVVALNLTINIIDIAVAIAGDGVTITANNSGATYQWIDCTNGNLIIAGETNQSFIATSNGDYAVILTENGCTDTSSCMMVTTVGIEDVNSEHLIKIFPNPTTDNITIIANGSYSYIIRSMYGSEVIHGKGRNKEKVSLTELAKGTYFISIIKASEKIKIIKIVKE